MSRFAKRIAALLIWMVAASPVWAGFDEGDAAYTRGNYATAFREFLAAAEKGNATAQFNVSGMYAKGEGAPKDYERAAFWVRKAADQGHARAALALGIFLEVGFGVPKDAKESVFWFRKAAEQGHADAQDLMGEMYIEGKVVPKDAQQAVFWYRKAAEQGNAHAQFNLGGMYYSGVGVTKDTQQALFWFRQAAEQGYAQGQALLGAMYDHGEALPKDAQQAVLWYRKAAEQGNVSAQVNLARLYARGEGVPKDDQQAAFWYHKAAEQGAADAQLVLAAMYNAGVGVAKDLRQAYFWTLLSAAQGNSLAAKLRDSVEQSLSPQKRDEAQAAAREWKPNVAAPVEAFAVRRALEATAPPTPAQREIPTSTGTGFFVARERVVTNHHVTEGCSRLRVDRQYEGRLLTSDAHSDLALISLQGGSPNVATIRAGKVKVGESAMVAGFPLSGLLFGFNVTTGNISSLTGMRGDTGQVQITAPVQPGNSGGPLLDAAGKVIGVVRSKLDALKVAESTGDVPQNVNFAINANVLASFLDANGVDYKLSPAGPAIQPQEVAGRAQAFTVRIECWK